ncbi:hypothetical protein NKW41_13140 [Gluconobacter oxydans]|nr:hypothetical protein [Gluconobacter oxydans]
MAMLITVRYMRASMPFNLGWWGFTFPLGVYTVATLKLGALLHLSFFNIVGTCLGAMLALLWIIVAGRTVAGAYRGDLFVSPCIASLKATAAD